MIVTIIKSLHEVRGDYMPKRGRGDVGRAILDTLDTDSGKKWTVQEVSASKKSNGTNWETTKRFLDMFSEFDMVRKIDEGGKTFYQTKRPVGKKTLYGIPVRKDHRTTLREIYATIRNEWNMVTKKRLTKTVMHKIAVDFTEKEYPSIPHAWYLFGQVMLFPPNTHDTGSPLSDQKQIREIRARCEYYSRFDDTHEIRLDCYKRKGEKIYECKENLYHDLVNLSAKNSSQRRRLRTLVTEFKLIMGKKELPSTVATLTEDFCSCLGRIIRDMSDKRLEEAKPILIEAFDKMWSSIALYEFSRSLIEKKFFSEEFLDVILAEKKLTTEETFYEYLELLESIAPPLTLPDDELGKRFKEVIAKSKEFSPEEKKKIEKSIDSMSTSELFRDLGID